MYNISPLPFTPDQRLDPPYIERADHDWAAVFRCHIGDEGLKVKVVCEVTCADEIDQLLDVVLPFLAGREVPRLAAPPLAVPTEGTRALRPAWRLGRSAPRRALP